MRKKKIAIVRADLYSGNRGVGALGISTLYLLNRISKEFDNKFELYVINSNYGDKFEDTVLIGSEIVKITNLHPLNLFNFKEALKSLAMSEKRRSFKFYRTFDYVLDMGSGDSFADIYGKTRFYSVYDQHRMARLFRKRLLLLPQTIGPFKNATIKRKANRSIEKADYVFARDNQSYEYVKSNTTQKHFSETIDVAFFMPYKKEEFSKDYIHVGLNVSALLWNGGYTRNNQFGLVVDYQQLVHSIIKYFLKYPNVKLHLIAHVVSAMNSVENDYAISYELAQEYKSENLVLAPLFLNPILAKNYIAGLDFFSGARMHATIAAFSSGIPVYPMSYSRKFNGLYIDTLGYNYMGDMTTDEHVDVINGLKLAFEKREELRDVIKVRLNTTVSERGKLIKKHIAEFLDLRY